MELVMYNEEQDALRIYCCDSQCWLDMKHIYVGKLYGQVTSLAWLMSFGWEVVGEL